MKSRLPCILILHTQCAHDIFVKLHTFVWIEETKNHLWDQCKKCGSCCFFVYVWALDSLVKVLEGTFRYIVTWQHKKGTKDALERG